jgi:hypothetical protein
MRQTGRVSLACAAGILGTLLACGKSKSGKEAADAAATAVVPALDLSTKPQLLFQLFGERDDPRLLPLFAVVDGAIRPIGLTPSGWKELDSIYFAAGTRYGIYRDDIEFGEVEVSAARPNVPLPGCKILKPIAAARLTFKEPRSDQTVEFIASSAPHGEAAHRGGTRHPGPRLRACSGQAGGDGRYRTGLARLPRAHDHHRRDE